MNDHDRHLLAAWVHRSISSEIAVYRGWRCYNVTLNQPIWTAMDLGRTFGGASHHGRMRAVIMDVVGQVRIK
jgi:acyl-CoA reductase-like NAD-dependent aldehyde dehydrogenase